MKIGERVGNFFVIGPDLAYLIQCAAHLSERVPSARPAARETLSAQHGLDAEPDRSQQSGDND
jgi:hypothetical protein